MNNINDTFDFVLTHIQNPDLAGCVLFSVVSYFDCALRLSMYNSIENFQWLNINVTQNINDKIVD